MARRPILEKWRASRGHLSPQEPKLPWSYPVLAHLSVGYPRLEGRLPTCYSPVRRFTRGLLPFLARLACVRHAASVRSEPGSNSPVELENVAVRRRRRAIRAGTALDEPGQTNDSFALSVLTALGTFSALSFGKGALLFSFQRPRNSRGRPSCIGDRWSGVKARSGPHPSDRGPPGITRAGRMSPRPSAAAPPPPGGRGPAGNE